MSMKEACHFCLDERTMREKYREIKKHIQMLLTTLLRTYIIRTKDVVKFRWSFRCTANSIVYGVGLNHNL